MSDSQDKYVWRLEIYMHRASDISDFKGLAEVGFRVATIIEGRPNDELVRLSGKSRKQLTRYGPDSNVPASVLAATQTCTGVSGEWLLNGIVTSHVDHLWLGKYLAFKANFIEKWITDRNSKGPSRTISDAEAKEEELTYLQTDFERTLELLELFNDGHFKSDTDYDWKVAEKIVNNKGFGLIRVPVVELRVAAGAGATVAQLEEVAGRYLSFDDDEFRALGKTSTTGLKAFMASGDSMLPTISDGAPILVDELDTRIRDGIFAFSVDNDLRVKRLHPVGIGDLELRSDNPLYPPELFTKTQRDELKIIGRVIWVGNRL